MRRPRENDLLPLASRRNHVPETNVHADRSRRPLAAVLLVEDGVHETLPFAAASTGEIVGEERSGASMPSRFADRAPYFEIYRAEEVRRTKLLYSGGDWCWRFRCATGEVLAAGVGYRSEAGCRAAVMALRDGAGSARIVAAS